MKTLTTLLIITLIAGNFAPTILVNAQTQIPHEDPNTTKNTIDSLSFITQYAEIFALMSQAKYDNASQLNQQLSHITVPPDLSYIINKYNQLTQELITQLNTLETTLNNASTQLDQHQLKEARQTLDQAGTTVVKAQILLTDLKDATSTVTQKLGALAATAGTKLQQAYTTLQNMLNRLEALIDRYYELLSKTNQRYEQIQTEKLQSTTTTLNLNAQECFVGEYLTASGSLTSNNQNLPNRAITILIDNTKIATTNTAADGTYKTSIQIPYKYVDSINISAHYTPTDNDKNTYYSSTSPTIKIKVLFYRTTLDVSIPNTAYPGLPLTINGNVTSPNGLPLENRQIKIILDDTTISQTTTALNGTFTTKTTINPTTKLGNHTIKVTVQPSGLYTGTTVQRNLLITKLTTTLEVDTPPFVLLPTQLSINGTVKNAGKPLNNTTVTLTLTDITASTKTNADGSFNLTLDIPFNTIIAGNQNLKITAQPPATWQTTAEKTLSIFMINTTSIAIMIAASVTVLSITYFKFTNKNKTKQTQTTQTQTQTNTPTPTSTKETPSNIPAITTQNKFTGYKAKIIQSYLEALKIIQLTTSTTATPNMTLREYLQLTTPKLNQTLEPFTQLTTQTEKTLYSKHPTTKQDAQKTEEQLNTIRKLINNGTK
jgi:hypothetical protein